MTPAMYRYNPLLPRLASRVARQRLHIGRLSKHAAYLNAHEGCLVSLILWSRPRPDAQVSRES